MPFGGSQPTVARTPKRRRTGSVSRRGGLARYKLPRQLSSVNDTHYFKETFLASPVVITRLNSGYGFNIMVSMNSLPNWSYYQQLFDVGAIVGFTAKFVPAFDTYVAGTTSVPIIPRLTTAIKTNNYNTNVVTMSEVSVLAQADSVTSQFDHMISRTCPKAVPQLSEGVEGTLTGAVSSMSKGLKFLNLDDTAAGEVRYGGIIGYCTSPVGASESDLTVGQVYITVTSAFKQQS